MVITSLAGIISIGRFGTECLASSARTGCGSFISWQFGHLPSPGLARKSWARRVLVLLLECLRFGLGITLHLVPAALGGLYRAFALEKLLFFQPVLLETRERSQTRIRGVGLAPALFVVQVGAAIRTQPPAVALANGLDGKRQKHLLFQHVRQEKPISFVKADFRIVILQAVFPMLGEARILGKRCI